MAMTFNPEKPIQTRDGRKARIICTDTHHLTEGGVEFPITALVMSPHNQERPGTYQIDWTFYSGIDESGFDLINIPEKRWAVLLSDFTWIQTYSEMSPGKIIPTNGPKIKCIACLEFFEESG